MSSRLLSFEEFCQVEDNLPHYRNFPGHFLNGGIPAMFRKQEYYQRFKQEAPDLEQRLRENIAQLPCFDATTLAPYNKDLYEAYKIMHKYNPDNQQLGGF